MSLLYYAIVFWRLGLWREQCVGYGAFQRSEIFHGVNYLGKKWSLSLVDLRRRVLNLEESSNISRREGNWRVAFREVLHKLWPSQNCPQCWRPMCRPPCSLLQSLLLTFYSQHKMNYHWLSQLACKVRGILFIFTWRNWVWERENKLWRFGCRGQKSLVLNEKGFILRNLGVYEIMERAEATSPNLGILEWPPEHHHDRTKGTFTHTACGQVGILKPYASCCSSTILL